jgi:hypothetical protein
VDLEAGWMVGLSLYDSLNVFVVENKYQHFSFATKKKKPCFLGVYKALNGNT